MLNKVFLMGRVSTDLTIYDTVVKFNIAVPKRYKKEGKPDANFFHCIAFGKTKEFIENWISKGMKVVIEGELQNNTLVSVDGGQGKTVDEIIVNSIEFAESKKSTTVETATVTPTVREGFADIDADQVELPFN